MSRPATTWYVTAHDTTQLKSLRMAEGEKRLVSVDWNGYLANRGATISSATWSSEDSEISISSATNSGGITSALLTSSQEGTDLITVAATLSNGEVLERRWRVTVTDPLIDRVNDYQT